MDKQYYLDEAATTNINTTAEAAASGFFKSYYGNPSSIHAEGRRARKAIDTTKTLIAEQLNCAIDEIIFTSGGTQGDNMCIKGYALANQDKGKNIIISSFEHPAVYESCEWLKRLGFSVTLVNPKRSGIVDPEDVAKHVTEDTILVSVMLVNNEIGTIQPIENIAKAVKKANPQVAFHTDAVQGFCDWFPNMANSEIDMFTVSGHKFGAMKGTGFCYIKKGVNILPLLSGGGQEFGKRSGTENTIGIVSLGAAVVARQKHQEKERLIDLLWDELKDIEGCKKVTDENTCCNIASFYFENIDATELVLLLSEEGIYCSAGSACHASSKTYSRTLLSIGLTKEQTQNVIRFSTNKPLLKNDIKIIGEKVRRCVDQMRIV